MSIFFLHSTTSIKEDTVKTNSLVAFIMLALIGCSSRKMIN